MMHRTDLYEDNEKTVYVKHNGDWSGKAEIVIMYDNPQGSDSVTLRIPGIAVKRLAFKVAERRLLGMVQDAVMEEWREGDDE